MVIQIQGATGPESVAVSMRGLRFGKGPRVEIEHAEDGIRYANFVKSDGHERHLTAFSAINLECSKPFRSSL